MKKIRMLTPVFFITLQLIVPFQTGYSQSGFKDEAPDYWATSEIRIMKEKGLIQGYDDGTFRPENPISRAEAAAIFVRMLELKPSSSAAGASPFKDVPLTHWSKDNILIAYHKQLLSGYDDGTFRPEDKITRAETSALLAKTFKLSEGITNKTFTDIAMNHWAYPMVSKLAANGLIEGTSNERFDPEKPITRAQFSVILARALEKKLLLAVDTSSSQPGSPAAGDTMYNLIPADWGIYNDGTHPVETAKGFNDALKWAHENGKTVFKVPAGTYTIQKGNPVNPFTPDRSARINMVSNMTFWLDDNSVIQKESNAHEGYDLMYIGPDAHNVTLKGGIYRGDRESHDYSNGRTHEHGIGIVTAGTMNLTIDGVKAEQFTGDGLVIGGFSKQIHVLGEADFESGGVNDNGVLIADPTKIRTKNSKTNFKDPIFQTQRTIYISNPQNIPKTVPFSLYFYQSDGTFVSSVKNEEINWSLIDIPADTGYFYAVFDTASFSKIRLEYWARSMTKNSVVKNSEFAFNRRQGITVGGADNVLITNNQIHDIQGTAPQSGIDLEGGVGENGNPNTNIHIKDNRIYNNAAYNVVLYDGQDVVVEDNYLGPNSKKSSIGVAVSPPFRTGAVIKNNTFDGSKIAVENEAAFIGNQMNDSLASFVGPGVSIDGMTFTDSHLVINAAQPFGVTASNITIINNNKSTSGLIVNKQPVHLTDITIVGESLLRSLRGDALDGSIFDNLKITGYSKLGLDFPRGTYNNCVIEAAAGGSGAPAISQPGKYEFNGCSFKNSGRGLVISNTEADVAIKNSSFEALGNETVLYVQKAKKISIQNNTINANHLVTTSRGIIKINEYGAASKPAGVLDAVIKNNTIISNVAAKGISTVDAGTGAPPYTIENNILHNAVLELRSSDVINNNIEK
jgi:hypothetical protein